MFHGKSLVISILVLTVAYSVAGRQRFTRNVEPTIVETKTTVDVVAEEQTPITRPVDSIAETNVMEKIDIKEVEVDSTKEKPDTAVDEIKSDVRDNEEERKIFKHMFVNEHLPALNHPLQTAFKKYSSALKKITNGIKTIQAKIMRRFTSTSPLQNPIQNATTESEDKGTKIQDEPTTADMSKPVEIMDSKPDESKPEIKPAEKPAEISKTKPDARKLRSSEVTAVDDEETVEMIAERMKVLVAAMREVNEEALNLVQSYLDRVTDNNRN